MDFNGLWICGTPSEEPPEIIGKVERMSEAISRRDVIALILRNREEEWKKSISADIKHKSVVRSKHDAHVAFCDYLIGQINQMPPWRGEKNE